MHHQRTKKYNCNVGYSGHEIGLAVSFAAFMFSISSLERHITLDRSMYGSDQAASLEMRGMKILRDYIVKMHTAVGHIKLGHITKDEEEIAKKLRKHIKLLP